MTKEGILKHKEVFDAWLSGAKVQYYGEKTKKWIDINNPSWELIIKYRIKPKTIEFKDCSFNRTEYKVNKIGNIIEIIVSRIKTNNNRTKSTLFKDKEIAEAYAVLPKLIRLRDEYNEGWKPDWGKDKSTKWVIYLSDNNINAGITSYAHYQLTFKTEEIRDRFLEDHKDLIEIAKPLL